MPKKFGPDNTGCIFDGVHGQYHNDVRVVELAAEYGFDISPYDSAEDYVQGDESGCDPTLDAVDWLNEHAACPNHLFAWIDGDFVFINRWEYAVEMP